MMQSDDRVVPLGFTKLVVEDLDKMGAFYGAVCGFIEEARAEAKIADRPIRELHFKADPPGTGTFTLTKFLDASRAVGDALILGFVSDNIQQFVDDAVNAGATVVEPVSSQPEHGVKVAFVNDPEGNLIEVVELL